MRFFQFRGIAGLAVAALLTSCAEPTPAARPDTMIDLRTVASGPRVQAEELDGAIVRQPRNASLYARRAAFRLDAGQTDAALSDINQALALDDAPGQFYFTKARALRAQGFIKAALDATDQAARRGFASPELNLLVGEMHLASRRYQDALDQLDRALQQEPDLAAALFYKGLAFVGVNDTAQALDYLRASVARAPREPEILHQLAFLSNAYRQPDQAAIYAARGLKLDSTYAPLWYDYGRQFELQNQPEQALRSYARVAQLDSTFYRADYRLGLAAYKARRYAQAVPHLQRALRRAPRLPDARSMLAESFESQGLWAEAADQYRLLVAENPGNRRWTYKVWKVGNRARGVIVDETPRPAPVEAIEPLDFYKPGL
ncbi:tetratricopeptide repeat protein [Hymenobacter lapidiphilus]|uniref:Tetratricopeptide repeat protein n=1 Tax=Hymenobacter lapidiphilus TaxID=2608003 RepID=A0A7Y7PKQ4_9BACT|nr:tetratricopeptide repeat protein [Hymenobacter lapidiphilus]NVO29586.1 tetratricopeptide repeat protein [Hymenobacter lapidiphilus]